MKLKYKEKQSKKKAACDLGDFYKPAVNVSRGGKTYYSIKRRF